jgi:hypothetical protein
MDFDVVSVEGESHLQVYMEVQQVTNDTDHLMWWKLIIIKSFPTWSE